MNNLTDYTNHVKQLVAGGNFRELIDTYGINRLPRYISKLPIAKSELSTLEIMELAKTKSNNRKFGRQFAGQTPDWSQKNPTEERDVESWGEARQRKGENRDFGLPEENDMSAPTPATPNAAKQSRSNNLVDPMKIAAEEEPEEQSLIDWKLEYGVMKARSVANRAKNRRALGMRRTKAEGRKLDSIFGRYQNVARNISTDRDESGISEFDRLHVSPEVLDATVKPARTAASIKGRNIDRERQGKRPIKNPYGEDFAHTAQAMDNPENPGSWTPAQQRLITDAEKGQQRAISRAGEQKMKAGKERQSKLGAIKRKADKGEEPEERIEKEGTGGHGVGDTAGAQVANGGAGLASGGTAYISTNVGIFTATHGGSRGKKIKRTSDGSHTVGEENFTDRGNYVPALTEYVKKQFLDKAKAPYYNRNVQGLNTSTIRDQKSQKKQSKQNNMAGNKRTSIWRNP